LFSITVNFKCSNPMTALVQNNRHGANHTRHEKRRSGEARKLQFEILPPFEDASKENRNRRLPRRNARGLRIAISASGSIQFSSQTLFCSWKNRTTQQFIEATFCAKEVREMEIDTVIGTATVYISSTRLLKETAQRLTKIYRETGAEDSPKLDLKMLKALPRTLPRLRLFRYGTTISTWELRVTLPGWMRFKNSWILGKPHFTEAIERELMTLNGVENFKIVRSTGSLSVTVDPKMIHIEGFVRHLDKALLDVRPATDKEGVRCGLPVATVSLGLAAASTFFAPTLLPVGSVLVLYTAIPSFARAWSVLTRERRLGVDVLDSIIFLACLFTGQIFAGAMTAWFLSLGRKLLRDTRKDSAKVLLNVFGKQPTFARVIRDGIETEVALESVIREDRVVVYTGEVVPVDGVIIEGDAILDQHALTGESTPAEKTIGDKVFASTVMLAGKILVHVDESGNETTSSKIAAVLRRTVAYKPKTQSRGETFGDKAVIPALGVSTVAASFLDPSAALAVINSECGTGIRMAAPLGMLTSLTVCAQQGILVKDGHALEMMREVDTVLFDKTGTLTRERPEVGRIICCGTHSPEEILTYAAAAEQRFSHPIAKAILERFAQTGLPIPTVDLSNYHVGFGITVQINGNQIRVGSQRFMEMEDVQIPSEVSKELTNMHAEGHSFVAVAVGNQVEGILELQASRRPEAEEIVQALRAGGVQHLAIISGDHEAPTRALAQSLGMDRYFAEVLPKDKARYVELLQKEGRKVCFVGDGINDSIALKKADVSISLRGASTAATDVAQVVFMEESLSKMIHLLNTSHALERNVRRSWNLILLSNTFCVAGVFALGFNIWHSVLFNNASAILALANGMLPLRKLRKEIAS
jgi:heavy metal translocating P-type ATPase